MTGKAAPKRTVTFKVRAPRAKKVQLAGDFNDWDPHAHPMEKDEQGLWKVGLRLAPGRYEYKLIVDGRWLEDVGNADSAPNAFGTRNRLLVVPEKQAPVPEAAPGPDSAGRSIKGCQPLRPDTLHERLPITAS